MGQVKNLITAIGLFLFSATSLALEAPQLLPPDQAFAVSAKAGQDDLLTVSWDIADGYYLYRHKFRFASKTPGVDLGEPAFPRGETKQDDFFGQVETYRDRLEVRLPLQRTSDAEDLALEVISQGCADIGVCYPPQTQNVQVALAESDSGANSTPLSKLTDALKGLGIGLFQDELLPPDQAFHFSAEVKDSETLRVNWQIAEDYYLYREKFKFELSGAPGVRLASYQVPSGKPKQDESFGRVEVFYHEVAFDLPLDRSQGDSAQVQLQAHYQGCAERGVCYPPMQKTVALDLPQLVRLSASPAAADSGGAPAAEQDRIARALSSDALWITVLTFLGFGVLLAFTPCCFPMIPILSGIIIGQGKNITTGKAFSLSLSYVLAAALTYTVFGVLAGLFGENLQAAFQAPWVIAAFSAVFVLLALSMFGFYELQMPALLQSRIAALSRQQDSGTLLSAFTMGALSALIIGPCVAAPLAGALIYIGQSGDAVLGGTALFALGFGMGIPLLVIGASAGKLLPKAGPWMKTIKAVFGIALLAVAVWLLERIVPSSVSMVLWALLLIVPAIYLGVGSPLPENASGWRKLWKGLGIVMLTYGILILIGAASNSQNVLQPLRLLAGSRTEAGQPQLTFERVRSQADLNARLQSASAKGQWVMLDFYADWCVSCKEMEHYTFTDPKVQAALTKVLTLQANVTQNSPQDKELLQAFSLIGPPAILFFGPDQQERKAYRVIGFMKPEQFVQHMRRIFHGPV